MKIVALGDTHGRVQWKEIVEKEKDADKIVFIGDYFDTHHDGVSGNKQLVNFKEIVAFKRANPDKVVLLFGNHDFHYIRGMAARGETYSGYQGGYAHDFAEAIHDAINDKSVQMCWMHDNFFFSHAGVTKTWRDRVFELNDLMEEDLVTGINDLFYHKPLSFCFAMGDNLSQSGNDKTQSPIWVRPQSLVPDMVEDIICVVGHTTVKELSITEMYRIILIDCLGTTGEYLIIEDGKPKSSKINLEF